MVIMVYIWDILYGLWDILYSYHGKDPTWCFGPAVFRPDRWTFLGSVWLELGALGRTSGRSTGSHGPMSKGPKTAIFWGKNSRRSTEIGEKPWKFHRKTIRQLEKTSQLNTRWSDTVQGNDVIMISSHLSQATQRPGRADPPPPMIAGKAAGMVHVLEHKSHHIPGIP